MSAGAALVAAVRDALAADELLDDLSVFDAPPDRRLAPYAVVEEPLLRAVDAAGVVGRAGALGIEFRDEGEVPGRLRALMAVAEDAVDALPVALGGGWRLAGIALARSRLARTKDGWLGRAEWAVRMFRVN